MNTSNRMLATSNIISLQSSLAVSSVTYFVILSAPIYYIVILSIHLSGRQRQAGWVITKAIYVMASLHHHRDLEGQPSHYNNTSLITGSSTLHIIYCGSPLFSSLLLLL